MDDIEIQVTTLISKHLGIPLDKITSSSAFIQDLGADSLDTVEMILAIEDQFRIEIPEEDAEKMETVALVIRYVKSKI